jgi:hypothetical protein
MRARFEEEQPTEAKDI